MSLLSLRLSFIFMSFFGMSHRNTTTIITTSTTASAVSWTARAVYPSVMTKLTTLTAVSFVQSLLASIPI